MPATIKQPDPVQSQTKKDAYDSMRGFVTSIFQQARPSHVSNFSQYKAPSW